MKKFSKMNGSVKFKRIYFVDYLLSSGGIIILLLFVGKLFYLSEISLPLSYDESYYWDWSRRLDIGYYSKPPMVAWVIYISTKFLGNTENAVRLPALLSSTLSLSILYVLACKYFTYSLGRLVLATFAFTPIFFVYSFVMTIDPPLIFFWSLSFYFLVSYLFNPSLLLSFFLGASIGLGLLTKQTMFIFYLLTILYFLILDRSYLKFKYTYLLIILPLIIYSPNLYWNVKNDFLMLQHTTEHFTRGGPDIKYFLNFLGGLFLLYGPLYVIFFFTLGIKFLAYTVSKFKEGNFAFFKSDSAFQFLFISFYFSFVPLLLLLPMSFLKKFNLNWIMPFFITSFFWVCALAFQRRVFKMLLFINLLIITLSSLFILVLVKNPELFVVKGRKPAKEVLSKFIGWRELARTVENYYTVNVPLMTNHREVASSLAFYVPGHPEVCVLRFDGRVTNQYHLWYDCEKFLGREVLYVQKGAGRPGFLRDPSLLEEVRIDLNGKSKIYQLWRGTYIESP